MKDTPGANIEDARGEMNVILESRERISHFRESWKFNGISGSSCDSQPTIPLSKSEVSSGAGASRAFLLLDVRFVAIFESLLLELDFVVTRWISNSSNDFLGPALMEVVLCES